MATTVPYSGDLSVAPEDRPIPSRSGDAPLSAFGGASAAAESQLGQQLQHSGTELWDRAIAMQQLNQQADAVNKVADLADKQTDEFMKFRSLEGKAAVDAFPGFKDRMNSIREDVGATLTSDYAKKLFLQESRAQQTRVMFSAAAHAGDQQKHYLIGTSEAKIDSNINSVVGDPTNEDTYRAKLQENSAEADNLQTIKGWSKEQRDDYLQNKNSMMVYNRVQALRPTQAFLAEKVLDQAVKEGTIAGDVAGRAKSLIRTQKLNVTARVESANLITGEGGHFGTVKVSPDRLLDAISSNESGGDYDPPHPDVTHKVNGVTVTEHALGRYGIMQSNLQPWLKEAGMPAMSEDQFLANSKAQDQLARFKLGQFQDQYGSANAAANVWFTGSPNPDPSRSDGGTTAARYLQKFNGALARSASGGEVRDTAERAAEGLSPNDPEFKETFSQRSLALHQQNLRVQREDDYYNKQAVYDEMAPEKDGRLKTSPDELSPEAHDKYLQMRPTDRATVNRIFAQNSKGDYGETPENQKVFRKYYGIFTNANPSAEESQEAMGLNIPELALPWSQRQLLMGKQKSLIDKTAKNPPIGEALHAIDQELNSAQLTKKLNPDDYFEFKGTLALALEKRIQANPGKPLLPEEFREMGNGLLREYVYSKSSWGSFFDSSAKVFKVPVPEAQRKEIIDRYVKDNNKEPSDIEIQRIHSLELSKLLIKQGAEKK